MLTRNKSKGHKGIFQDRGFRFLLVGKTGAGKSATGNTILGEKKFVSDFGFEAVTSKPDLQRRKWPDLTIEVMDLPGLFDTERSSEDVSTEVLRAVVCLHPGPDAILYVLKIGQRYTDEEYAVFNRLKTLLDDRVTQYMIVIFTHGDILEKKEASLQDVLAKAPQQLKQVLEECAERYVVFNNERQSNDRKQVDELLHMTEDLRIKNDHKPYTCPKYAQVGQKLEMAVKERLEASERRNNEHLAEVLSRLSTAEKGRERLEQQVSTLQSEVQNQRQNQQAQQELRRLQAENARANLERTWTEWRIQEERQRRAEKGKMLQNEMERLKDELKEKDKYFFEKNCILM